MAQINMASRPAADASLPYLFILGVTLWHLLLAVYLVSLSLGIFAADTLVIAGRSADLGRPVQVFAGSVLLVPAFLAVFSSLLLFLRRPAGRFLALGINLGAAVLALFALFGLWGLYGSFERLVDGIMLGGTWLIGLALAYALFWFSGRLEGSAQRTLRNLALIIGLVSLGGILLAAGIINGIAYLLSSYGRVETWVMTAAVIASALSVSGLIDLGEAYRETPEGREAWQGWFMLSPNIIGFLFFFAGPLLLSFYMSFTNASVGRVPQVTGFSNYGHLLSLELKVLPIDGTLAQNNLSFGYAVVREYRFGERRLVIGARDRLFWISLFNTLIYCAMLLPLAIIPALIMALILNSSLPGMQFFRALYFLPSVAAVVGTALIWRWLYTPTTGFISYTITQVTGFLGLPDPEIQWLSDPRVVLISVVLLAAWQVVGYNTVLFLAGLQGIPKSLYEAAKIDGANPWQRFWNVTLPMLAPTTFFVIITTMVTGLQAFNEPYALFPYRPIPEGATTLVYYLYTVGFNQFNFGYASALAWVLFVLIFGFTFIQFRLNRSQAYG